MKTVKLFFMAALALMTAACSNDDNDFDEQPQKAKGITITAQLAPKTNGTTRAVADNDDNKITVTWAEGEHIAILYNISGTKYAADAEITNVDGDGAATITFTVQDGTPDNTSCTLVYPLSAAKDDNSGVKDYATLLDAQDGTLNANLDVRVGEGTIKTTTPSLSVTTQPAAQFCIFKLTMKDIDGSADVSASSVVISDQSGKVTTVTPASGYDKVMYVALPTSATTLKFLVTVSDSKKYFNMASDLSLETKFYQSTIKLATIGNVIASNGKCYKNMAATPGGNTAVAMITYLGNDAETNTTYKNGLALALTDASSGTVAWCAVSNRVTCLSSQYNSWSSAGGDMAGIANTETLVNNSNVTVNNSTHKHAAANAARNYQYSVAHPTGTSEWFLPSYGQWYKMIIVKGYNRNADNYKALCESFSSVGGTNMGSQNYWSSTEYDKDYACRSYYNGTTSDSRPSKGNANKVRAGLAF